MATIAITQDLRLSGSELVSVHNFNKLKWTFVPTDDTKVITSKIVIAGVGIFNGVEILKNTGTTPDTYSYELDVSDILKYCANSFYHALANEVDQYLLSPLVGYVDIGVIGYEDGVQTDSETLGLYLSHGLHQIGNPYGSNMKELYDRDNLLFHYFRGYPVDLYYYIPVVVDKQEMTIDNAWVSQRDIAEYSPGLALLSLLQFNSYLTKGLHVLTISDDVTNVITDWTNVSIDSFASTDENITLASDFTNDGHYAQSNEFTAVAGEEYIIDIDLTIISGDVPVFRIQLDSTHYNNVPLIAGSNKIKVTVTNTGDVRLLIIKIDNLEMECSLTINKFYKLDPDQVINIKSFEPCDGGKYIKYLSREGFYRYWLFNKYFTIEGSQTKIGSLVNYFDTMVGSQGRTKNIGYKDALQKIIVTSENVDKEDQRMLMDIFTSPAVYLWTATPGTTDIETLWTLVDVEGSHQIKEKNNFQEFTCTLVLPELYMQKL